MRILLTGALGFIATHVRKILDAEQHVLVCIDSVDTRVHKDGLPKELPEACWFVDYGKMDVLPDVDVVIHLAAQVSVADSMKDPLRYVEQNTMGTARFLERLNPETTKRLVVASSMSVYGEGGQNITEDAPVKPASVYGLTKYDQEQLCLLWGERMGIPVTALRFWNVYGPGQSLSNPYTGVLANFASALMRNESPTIYEDGLQTRDFVYVEDVARAVTTCATGYKPVPGIYNVCTGAATSILQAERVLAKALGKEHVTPTITGTVRPGDIRHCTGNPGKLEQACGWRAMAPFTTGIQQYAGWLTR